FFAFHDLQVNVDGIADLERPDPVGLDAGLVDDFHQIFCCHDYSLFQKGGVSPSTLTNLVFPVSCAPMPAACAIRRLSRDRRSPECPAPANLQRLPGACTAGTPAFLHFPARTTR